MALGEVVDQKDAAIYIFKDLHPSLGKNNFAIIRKLRDIAHCLKSSHKTLVLLSPFLNLAPELEKDLTVIDYQLPLTYTICAPCSTTSWTRYATIRRYTSISATKAWR